MHSAEHKLGLAGEFLIQEHLQKTATHYGLFIDSIGDSKYQVSPKGAELFCPSFIKHSNGVFDGPNLKKFLLFLHQPLKILAAECKSSDKNNRKDNEITRENFHRLLRFATTGSVSTRLEEEKKSSGPDCHADAERRMKQKDLWRSEQEIGNNNIFESAIPNSHIDTRKGFAFNLSDSVFKDPPQQDMHTRELQKLFFSTVQEVKKEEAAQPILYLSGPELESFCRLISQTPNLKTLLRKSGIEQEASITKPAKPANDEDIRKKTESEINTFLKSTTALTSIFVAPVFEKAWAKFHWTKKNYSPFPEITRELEILSKELEQHSENPHPEAVAHTIRKFSSLINFSERAAAELGLTDIHKVMRQTADNNIPIAEDFLLPHHQEALSLIKQAMEHGHSPLIQFIKDTGSSLKTVIAEGFEYSTETKNRLRALTAATALYMASIVLMNNPAVINKINKLRGAEQKQQTNVAYVFGEDDKLEKVKVTGQKPTVAAEALPKTNPAQPETKSPKNDQPQFCHAHIKGVQVVQHCFFNEKVKDFMYGTMDGIERGSDWAAQKAKLIKEPTAPFSGFSKNARGAVSPTANFWLYFNLVQLLAHVPFFSMMRSRGKRQGIYAYKETRGLFGEFADLGLALIKYRPLTLPASLMAGTAAGMNEFGITSVILSGIAAGMAGNQLWKRQPGIKETISQITYDARQQAEIMQSLDEAAQTRNDLEKLLPEDIQEAALNIRLAGLRHRFKISAQNLGPTLVALEAFDNVITHASAQIGMNQSWYQDHLKQQIITATEALKNYIANNDQSVLQKQLSQSLAEIIGAEVKFTERNNIYHALFNENSKSNQYLARRHGDINYASASRVERIRRFSKKFLHPEEGSVLLNTEDRLKSSAVIVSNALWHSVVNAYRQNQALYENVPHKKQLAMGLASVTAGCIALDMIGQIHILGEHFGTAAQMTSDLTGKIYGFTGTTASFGSYNIYDDTILTDSIGGISALTIGVGEYYLWNRAAKPVIAAASKNIQRAPENSIYDFFPD